MALDHDPHAGPVEPRLLDRIDAVPVLCADPAEDQARLVEELGGRGSTVGHEIVRRLSEVEPLRQPDDLPGHHRPGLRSLAMLHRDEVRTRPYDRPALLDRT